MGACRHSWVAGMMYVADEDLDAVAAVRPVTCEYCDRPYAGDEADMTDESEETR